MKLIQFLAVLVLAMALAGGDAMAAISYMDSEQWTYHRDVAAQRGLTASVCVYGVQVWQGATLLDDYYLGRAGHRIAWADTVIAATTVDGYLFLLSSADSTNLTLLYSGSGYGASPDVAIRSDSLFTAGDGANDFQILDISDPTSPSVLGTLALSGPEAVALADTFALVVGDSIWSIGYSLPSRADFLVVAGSSSVAFSGGTGAAGRSGTGFTLFDASDAGNLVSGATVDPGPSVRDVILSVTGDSLWAICDTLGCVLYDVSDINSPVALDTSVTLGGYYTPQNGCLQADSLYFAHWSHLKGGVIQLNATSLDSIGQMQGFDYCRDVAAGPNAVYGCAGDMGLVCSTQADSVLTERGRLTLLETWGADSDGATLYLASTSAGLVSADFSDRDSPVALDTLAVGSSRSAVLGGAVVYVAAYTSGLAAVGVSSPSSLSLLDAEEHGTSFAYGVAVADTFCVTADGSDGLNVWSINDPATLTHLGNYTFSDDADDVSIGLGGNVAYVVVANIGVVVIDLADPAAPDSIYTFGSTNATGVCLYRGILTVTAAGDGVYCYAQGSSPLAPVLLDSYNSIGYAYKPAANVVDGRYYVYVADREALLMLRLDVDADAFCQ